MKNVSGIITRDDAPFHDFLLLLPFNAGVDSACGLDLRLLLIFGPFSHR